MTAAIPFAEVIGDPVGHSKSPLIHRHWLEQLGLEGDYIRSHVPAGKLGPFLEQRRRDSRWRGCNVTIPHKESMIAHVDALDVEARAIGAVNCVVPREGGLYGYNSDVDGIAAALDATDLKGEMAVMIGAGGAARAAAAYLARREIERLLILVRNPRKAESLSRLVPQVKVEIVSMTAFDRIVQTPALIVNASPLGMAGQPAIPPPIIENLSNGATDALFFDMVYEPLETAFLKAGRAGGARTVDGLTMLLGQAARAFALFFDAQPPPPDTILRDLLTGSVAQGI